MCNMTQTFAQARAFSRYVRRQFDAHPEWETELAAELAQPLTRARIADWLAAENRDDETALKRALRRVRQKTMLVSLARDLAGLADLSEVVQAISALADLVVREALSVLSAHLAAQYGEPIAAESGEVQQLIVVGMGKLGGYELNVSSDIDLIFIYPEDGETSGPKRISNHEYFTVLGRRLIAALNDLTEDGFVFRVDMRLRPYGDSGPLVMSFAMLEEYLVAQGREWERFAWMKARAMTGDAAGLAQLVRPFVFRKYLDYGAYQGIRDLHAQIRQEVARRDRAGNIKLGPGGIRELEFIGQIFQLIRGGRETRLQVKGTLEVLPRLRELALLPAETVAELWGAYDFLRRLEHRLQYLDDQQTQMLPTTLDDRENLAQSMGFADFPAFETVLEQHRQCVSRHFNAVFEGPGDGDSHRLQALWQGQAEQAEGQLADLGFQQPAAMQELIAAFRESPKVQSLPASNRRRLDILMPPLIEAAAAQRLPDDTLRRLMALMEAIGRRQAYLALLSEYPQLLARVAQLYAASPWVSDFLTHHPILLDELLDPRLSETAQDRDASAAQLARLMQEQTGDVEAQMNSMREFQHAQVFRLVVNDLAGRIPLMRLSDHLSDLADLILQESLTCCWQDIKSRHCEVPRFAVIGYGKLGAKEIGYASDLDIIFLYDDDHEHAQENYAKLAKKLNTWLTTFTRAGILYETDLRLRPNGASGLLVSSIAAFEQYQSREAWVWEHQALTRARYCAGDVGVGQAFDAIRTRVLQQPRDAAELRREVLAMRQKMRDNRPPKPGYFDLKQDAGGLIDLEFAVQYLVLREAHQQRMLTENCGNIELLRRLGQLGFLDGTLAEAAARAYAELREAQHAARLAGQDQSRHGEPCFADARAAIHALWQAVLGD